MRVSVFGFRTIVGRIMIVGSSAVAPSCNRGFYYTSDGANHIWHVLDEAAKAATGENPGFVGRIDEYKAMAKSLTEQEFAVIADLHSRGKFLCDADEDLKSKNLKRMAEIQKDILQKMNRYGFGFADAVAKCTMEGTDDKSRKDTQYNTALKSLLPDVSVVVVNGMKSNKKESSYRSFRAALGLNGKKHDAEYRKLKTEHSIIDYLPSTSGQCGRTKESPKLTAQNKIQKWVEAIREYVEVE